MVIIILLSDICTQKCPVTLPRPLTQNVKGRSSGNGAFFTYILCILISNNYIPNNYFAEVRHFSLLLYRYPSLSMRISILCTNCAAKILIYIGRKHVNIGGHLIPYDIGTHEHVHAVSAIL